MVEIIPNLFIGDESDCMQALAEGEWHIVHACKEPYHRQALGYRGRGAPKDHPEYLIARREDRLILNLVDAPDPAYIPPEIIDAALEFIRNSLAGGHRVLVHCNQGESRSATVGMIYLLTHTDQLPRGSLEEAEAAYRTIYPSYRPGNGMRGFLSARWGEYAEGGGSAGSM